ncbi:PAS domain S-box protein [Ktedonospora formicarum]|uniref:histidine kinase n=1 Tax=Ktedonospora formicarum TaxID=2778364 RepID=A0A8J3I0N9_9CHLR|nr:PAS domain S-box protein [Ktedonospora formicarum]GHO47159.1 hypothetical protein KSX_53220 [Ktedonospora formicarum]
MSLSEPQFHREEKSLSSPELVTCASWLQALAHDCADIFWMLTPTGEMYDSSSSWHAFTGQQEQDCRGKGWLDTFHPADQQQGVEALTQAVVSGRPQEATIHILRDHDTYHLISLRFVPVPGAFGEVSGVFAYGRDLTKQEQIEQMSDMQIQLALKASRVGMWDWDLTTGQLMWTNQKKALFGWPPETPISYERFLNAVHPDDREHVHQRNVRSIAEQQEYCKDYRTIWPDGSIHWLSDRARGIADASGKVVHIVGATLDITELKQTEEQLQEAHQQVSTILESITDAFVHVDSQWHFTYVNRWMEDFLGRNREALVGRCLWDVLPDLLGTPFEHFYRRAMATHQALHFEARRPITQQWLDVHVYPSQDGLAIALQNITERKQMEEALQESEARFHRLVESNIISVMMADPEGNVHEANDAFLSLLGYTREDMAAGLIQWKTITAPEVQARDRKAMEEVMRVGVAQPYEKEYVTKDGKRVPVLIGRVLFRWGDTLPLFINVVLDLTASKELERQKDLFLGMTGHELKNPLAALR